MHWYASWYESWSYDGGLVSNVLQANRTPMITWEAWNHPLSAITAGQFDSYIDSWANGMAAQPHPILLRIFHEFNDPRTTGSGYPWGVGGEPAISRLTWSRPGATFTIVSSQLARRTCGSSGVPTA